MTWRRSAIKEVNDWAVDQGKGYAICTGSESYYTPDPDNCHNFFGCVYDELNDFFHVYKFECQTGLAYDPNTHS